MKKATLLLLLAVLASGVTFGQFALGVKIGYNANKLSTNIDTIKNNFNSGFNIGAWTRFGKRLYVAPEIQYTMSGAVFTSEGNVSTDDWKQKITIGSLDIPVLVGVKIIHSDFITWRVELGPQASFVVNKKIKDQESITGPITEADINSVGWSILGGTGVDFLFMRFDVRYQYGFNDVIEDAKNYQFNSKNQAFIVSLGFKLFGKK